MQKEVEEIPENTGQYPYFYSTSKKGDTNDD